MTGSSTQPRRPRDDLEATEVMRPHLDRRTANLRVSYTMVTVLRLAAANPAGLYVG